MLRSDHAPINMLSSLKKLLAIFEERGDVPGLQRGDLRLATAVLMVHAAAIDGREKVSFGLCPRRMCLRPGMR